MSKSLAQFAQLLAASNEQLFDRYVNVTLYQRKPKTISASQVKKIISLNLFNSTVINFGTTDFAIKTPKTGMKPNITVSGQFQLSNTVNVMTITIVNINANIDTMAYNWVEVEMGYMNSGICMSFLGEITNCYMAKPNPNGELVISATCSDIGNLYARGAFSVEFLTESTTTPKLIETCINAMIKAHPDLIDNLLMPSLSKELPTAWQTQEFGVGKAIRHFRSPLECIAWMNSLFASCSYNTGFDTGPGGAPMMNKEQLPPLRLGFNNEGKLVATGFDKEASPAAVKTLSAIGSAFMTSTASATLTAPFNPDILPGDVIAVDPKYFRTRVNIGSTRESYKSMGNLWRVTTIAFTFSTMTTNTMTLQLANVDNVVTAQEG